MSQDYQTLYILFRFTLCLRRLHGRLWIPVGRKLWSFSLKFDLRY